MSYADRHKAKYAGQGETPRPALVAGAPALRKLASSTNTTPVVNAHIAQYVAGLEADLLRIKQVSTREERATIKRAELLPRYLPLVQELEGGIKHADLHNAGRIIFYCMVWSLDVHDWRVAIDLANLMGKHGISSYDDFSRTPPNIVAGQMASWCNDQHSDFGGLTAEPALSWLLDFASHHARTLLEPIMADIAKAQGGEAEQVGDIESAIDHYRRALSFNPNAGVKRLIARLEKQLPVANLETVPTEMG